MYTGFLSLNTCSGSKGVNKSVRKTVAFSISLSLPVAFQSFVFDRKSKVQPRLEGSTSS